MTDSDVPALVELPGGEIRPAVEPTDPPFVRLRKTRDDDYTDAAVDAAEEAPSP